MKKYNIGVDLGGTKVLCALIEEKTQKIVFEVKKKTKKEKGNKKVLKKLIEALDELFENINVDKNEIKTIGIAIAGQVDRENGVLLNSCNLECSNLEIKKFIEEKYGIKVFLANDVEAASIAEITYGAAKGYNDILCIFVGTGIGSCIVINGKIHRGKTRTAGEIGHTIINSNGRNCACGSVGCLEAYASRSAIENRIKSSIKSGAKSVISDIIKSDNISTKHIKYSLDAKDELVQRCVNEAVEYLSDGISNVINFLNPELIVLGGGLIQGIDEIYSKVVHLSKRKALSVPASQTEFKKAYFEDYSGVIGASLIGNYLKNNDR